LSAVAVAVDDSAGRETRRRENARVPERADVRCTSCGDTFTISRRRFRHYQQEGRDWICDWCRYPPVIVVTDALLDWWRERFSPAEIAELVTEAFGPSGDWPRQLRG
jgi:hypothetical protein